MAALPTDRVYQGHWVDYTRGTVSGATITTTTGNANLVIAVLSLLVAFTGSHLWDLIALAIYCNHISKTNQFAFHHQRQLLARNLTSPGAFILEMVKMGYAWRRQRQSWPALVLVGFPALVCSVGLLTAGIFVSLAVSNTGIQVLAKSSSCGFLTWRNESTNLHRQYQQAVFSQAMIYSEACYNKTANLPQCNLFTQRDIPIQHTTDAECPFSGLCTNHTARTLDTGLLDSSSTFGINSPSNHRVQMQRAITCAPLNLTQFHNTRPFPAEILKTYSHRDPLPWEFIHEWALGPPIAKSIPYNATVWMSNYTSQFSRIFDLTPRAFYAPVESNPSQSWHNSTFNPLPVFRKAFADTHILAIQNNGVRFWTQNEDPLFAAHRNISVFFDNNSTITMYTGDSPASFLGCTEQFKFCFSEGDCTDLLGVDQAFYQAQKIAPTLEQNVTLSHLFHLTPTWYGITSVPMQVTKNAPSFQLGIPPYQWKLEMFTWFNFLLAVTQSAITHLAAGPGIVRPDFDQLAEPLSLPSICHGQRMGAPDGYSNINVLGFIIVVVFSAAVIITNLTLVPVLTFFHRYDGRLFPFIGLWIQDGMLQVQRKAYEGINYTGWSSKSSDVPTMESNALLLALSAEAEQRDLRGRSAELQNAHQTQNNPETINLSEVRSSPFAAPSATSAAEQSN